MNVTLNIGLARNDGRGNNNAATVLRWLQSRRAVSRARISYAGAEPTLIAEVIAPVSRAEAWRLCEVFAQDCIALSTGELVGPRAAAWAPFNAEYFQSIDAPALAAAA